MQRRTLIAALTSAAFAFPLAATSAGTDKASGAKPASANTWSDGGAEAMFASIDKNGDGFISKEEAASTPHAADFASLDKNADGKLSRDEHFVAKEHVAARSAAGSTASSTNAPASSKNAPASSTNSTASATEAASTKKTY